MHILNFWKNFDIEICISGHTVSLKVRMYHLRSIFIQILKTEKKNDEKPT